MIVFVGDLLSSDIKRPVSDFLNSDGYRLLLDFVFTMNLNINDVCVFHRNSIELGFWKAQYKTGLRNVQFVALNEWAAIDLNGEGISSYFKFNENVNTDEQLEACLGWINEQEVLYNKR